MKRLLAQLPVILAVGAVRGYQYTLRPIIGHDCRFHPRCSDFAIEALRLHGAGRGGVLAARRVLRCNPWSPGGVDLVPRARKGS
jgi:putative membrane protein insertion efficiency factor